MVVHSPVADSFAVGHILVGDSLVEGIPAEDNLDTLHLAAGNPAAAHTPVADNLDILHLGVDSPVVAAHNPAVLCSVADIVAFLLAADNFAAEDSSFGFVRAAAALLPVVRNTCKTALRPATAGNNVYNA